MQFRALAAIGILFLLALTACGQSSPTPMPPEVSVLQAVTACSNDRPEQHPDVAGRAAQIPELWTTAMVLSCWALHGSDEDYRLHREELGLDAPPKIQPSWQRCLEEAVGYDAAVEHGYRIFVTPTEEVEFSGVWSQCVPTSTASVAPAPTPTISVYDAYPSFIADLMPQQVLNCAFDREGERQERLSPGERAEQEIAFADGIPEEWQLTLHTQSLSCWAVHASDAEYVAFMDGTGEGDNIFMLPSWQLCIEEAMGPEGIVATVIYASRYSDTSLYSDDALQCLPSGIS